jgi:hypothetical protein
MTASQSERGFCGPQIRKFLRKRPVLCLLLLAPLVEYLTGSSRLSDVIANPLLFFVFLFQNLAFYGPGVLLIREAKIRWRKGWASVILLGSAYGVLEEGVGTGVLFNPATMNFGGAGTYGHWLGVNWINVAILVPIVHPLFSISLPILLADLALPETHGKSLLSTRAVLLTFIVFGIDVFATSFFVATFLAHFFAGPLLLVGCFVAISILVLASRRVPTDFFKAEKPIPSAKPLRFVVYAAAFPWIIFIAGGILANLVAPPVLVIFVILGFGLVMLRWVVRNIGRNGNVFQKVGLATGLVVGLIPMGILSQIGTGIGLLAVLAGDLVSVLFLRYLWQKYRRLGQRI